jgi:hypothetical protein
MHAQGDLVLRDLQIKIGLLAIVEIGQMLD